MLSFGYTTAVFILYFLLCVCLTTSGWFILNLLLWTELVIMDLWTYSLWFVMDENRTFKTSGFDAASTSEAPECQNHVNIVKYDALCIII